MAQRVSADRRRNSPRTRSRGRDAARAWMRGPNLELGQPPIQLIASPIGLASVGNYLGRMDR
ncbi:MbcA/ParS/Xre antitoxin family protein [Lysobacter xanthus]